MNVEELDVVWLFERQGVHAKWTHTDRVQQLAVAGIAERRSSNGKSSGRSAVSRPSADER